MTVDTEQTPVISPESGEDRAFVTALARGLEVLSCFRSGNRALGNQELAQRCKLPKSTVSRLTYTLTRLGYLVQVQDSGKFRLGTATLSLGSNMLARMDVRQVARPFMQELADFARAMVSLGARDRLSIIYVETCRSSAALTLNAEIGSGLQISNSAIGRAYLAAVSEQERGKIMGQIKDLDDMAWPKIQMGIDNAMEDYRTLGVACSFGDWQQDVNGIARAFSPGEGLAPMVINCGGPSFTLSKEFLVQEVRPRLIEVATKIEDILKGHR